MGKCLGTDDFVITSVLQGYGFNGTSYQIVTLKDAHGNMLNPTCFDGSYKLESLCLAARGTTTFSVPNDLIGRVVSGTIFENMDDQGNKIYNVDYFKQAEASYKSDMFFFYPEETWEQQQLDDHYNRLDYVQYLLQTFNYNIPACHVELSKATGPHK